MFGTIRELWVALANYVHWCNNFRLHSTLGYTVQAEFKKADLVLSEYSKEVQLIRSVSSKGLLEDTIVGLCPALSGRFAALKNPEVVGSNPALATKHFRSSEVNSFGFFVFLRWRPRSGG